MKDATHLTEQQMRRAIARRDADYDGRFVYGVITTGVFCRPICAARPARPENVRFFTGVAEARAAGFRPCRRCRPEDPQASSQAMVALARYIESHADEKLTLKNLAAARNISPGRLQKAFKKVFGVSPKAYQDAVRMNTLKSLLKAGSAVTDATYESGYGSSSRLYEQAARNLGMTPRAYRSGGAGEEIAWACRATALGPLMMAATGRGVCFAAFGDSEGALLADLRREFPRATLTPTPRGGGKDLDRWMAALDAHLSANAPRPDIPVDLRGTAFQIRVWRFLLGLAEGDTVSYGDVAAGIGRATAARAAARACAGNRIAVLVPCHRVLRGDGGLGGYRWGADRKRALLDAERRRAAAS